MNADRTARLLEGFAESLGRQMDAAGVDPAGIASRTNIPVERVEGFLNATVEVLTSEFVLIAYTLGVMPSDMLPKQFV